MGKTDFHIVFEKLAEATEENKVTTTGLNIVSEATVEEYDEISELRRLSNELTLPEVVCFTTT